MRKRRHSLPMIRLPVALMTPHPPNSHHRRKKMAMSLRSRPTVPSSLLENLPPELRYMIYSHLLTDRDEQKLFHPLMCVSKQISADFSDTVTKLLGAKAQLTVEVTDKTVYFELGFNIPKDGQIRFHDVVTGSDSRFTFHTQWNRFRGSAVGRQMLARTTRVILRWPFLNTTFWIIFEPGAAPDVELESRSRLSIDARTRVTSQAAETMLSSVAKDWRGNKEADSAVWTDAFVKDLRRKWKVLRKEAREARRRQAAEEAERRRATRELQKRKIQEGNLWPLFAGQVWSSDLPLKRK